MNNCGALAWETGHASGVLSLALSTVAVFVSRYFIKRMLDDAGLATAMTRGVWIFWIAPVRSYGVADRADFPTT